MPSSKLLKERIESIQDHEDHERHVPDLLVQATQGT